jgi:hypothetical protein
MRKKDKKQLPPISVKLICKEENNSKKVYLQTKSGRILDIKIENFELRNDIQHEQSIHSLIPYIWIDSTEIKFTGIIRYKYDKIKQLK